MKGATRNPLPPHEWDLIKDLPTGSMCELGAKQAEKYKRHFEYLGWNHVSIDLNGTGGALPLDLQQPIDVAAIGGPFDVVTNFGTSEHVNEQEPCWRNIHALLRTGGTLVSCTPLDWPKHGRWYPSEEWYRQFLDLNGYELSDLWFVTDACGYKTICVRARKALDLPFIFPSLPIFEMTGGKTGAYI